ncbi:MAG: helix-turn-helix transcriptional regulator [Planctomycetota bacterium]|nr:helix-turn-helix transcriptional regulator [Planctomycetota bacterium]
MADSLLTILTGQLVPALEALTPERLVLPHEAGKASVGAFPGGGGSAREEALDAGEDVPGFGYSYGSHAGLELIFGVHGRAELAMAGRRYTLAEGDVAIVPSGVPHLERLHSRQQGYHLLWLCVAPDRLAMHSSSYSRGNRFQLVRGASIPRCGAIGRCFEAAAEEAAERGTLWFQLVRARLLEGLVLAARHIQENGPGQDPMKSRQSTVDVAKVFLQSHFSQELTLDAIAKEVFLSPNYFSSLFTQTEGKTVFEYLHEVRIDEAKRLLAETDLPVRQIARRVGIPSPSYFCRLFRRTAGKSAKDYRTGARP